MEEEISKYFGPVVNGKSGKTTTDLCLNRWKATLLTCPEMLQYMEKQMQDREAAAKEKAAIQAQREADKAMRTVGATKSCDGGNTTRCKAKVLKTAWVRKECGWAYCTDSKCNYFTCPRCSSAMMNIHLIMAHNSSN